MHLWNTFNFLRTRGKHYQVCEGHRLFYSYSVYDSYDLHFCSAHKSHS